MSKPLTVSENGGSKTDETEETDLCSNQEFLHALFGESLGEVRPIVVHLEGNPTKAPKSGWSGRPWLGETTPERVEVNAYFSLAMFRPDESGRYRHRKSQFHALCAVMLDDLGGKIPLDRLTLPPTWLLETSPGNFQAGYALREPLEDGLQADHLMDAIITAGLCDPGANGPCARLARLPVGINGKHQPAYRCKMQTWEPARRYTVDELVAGLQLDVAKPRVSTRREVRPCTAHPEEGDAVWLPRPEVNPVIMALGDRGLYKGPLGGGKHDITCPWADQHTGGADHGTVYFEPDNSWPIGGFKCQHGHCADRKVRDLLTFLGIEPSKARMKPTIRVVAGEIHLVVDAAERELAKARRYYQRGGLIVAVHTDPGTREIRIQDIKQPALVRALSEVAAWERFDGRSKTWVRTDPPGRHVAVLFDSTGYPHLPVLNGLARQPYLRPDGSLVQEAGYDIGTSMFGVFDAREFSIPANPTRPAAEAALKVLSDLLGEFSFARDVDRAAALTAILTACVRPSLPTAPMFHMRAHMPSSGKSYLCQLITAFATPQRGTPATFPGDDEECRKLLLAELLRAPAVIEFDNLTKDLVAHKSLCTALTSEFMTGRILGVSKTASVSTRTLMLSSGNNVGPVQDMTRRCITIHLSPQCETPASRTFARPNLVMDVLQDRGRFVSAAMTIIGAWVSAGRPQTLCKALSGFEAWSSYCRQPLLWLGVPDSTASVFEAMAEDPDRELLARFMDAWMATFGRTGAMVRDALHRLATNDGQTAELSDVLEEIAGESGAINARKLGWWIRRHAGRIVDGRRLAGADGNASAGRWKVDVLPSVLSVSPVSSPDLGGTAAETTA
jgi:hypothetical protein